MNKGFVNRTLVSGLLHGTLGVTHWLFMKGHRVGNNSIDQTHLSYLILIHKGNVQMEFVEYKKIWPLFLSFLAQWLGSEISIVLSLYPFSYPLCTQLCCEDLLVPISAHTWLRQGIQRGQSAGNITGHIHTIHSHSHIRATFEPQIETGLFCFSLRSVRAQLGASQQRTFFAGSGSFVVHRKQENLNVFPLQVSLTSFFLSFLSLIYVFVFSCLSVLQFFELWFPQGRPDTPTRATGWIPRRSQSSWAI